MRRLQFRIWVRLVTTRALNDLDPPRLGRGTAGRDWPDRHLLVARQNPLNTPTGKDLRILIGQNIGLPKREIQGGREPG
jgi:hypothetical protein